jgi:hypothetical protein
VKEKDITFLKEKAARLESEAFESKEEWEAEGRQWEEARNEM